MKMASCRRFKGNCVAECREPVHQALRCALTVTLIQVPVAKVLEGTLIGEEEV